MAQNTSTAVMQRRHEAHEVILRRDAKAQGLLRYFTGEPCPKGHLAERLVSSCGCLECCRVAANPKRRETAAAYYLANAEERKAAVRERWQTSPQAKALDKASRDARRQSIRAYDRMRAKRDRDKKRVIIDRWIENNPERYRQLNIAKSHRRRARIAAVGGSFSADDIEQMWTAQGDRCWWCNARLKGEFHVDHRIPIAKGGANDRSNIVIACVPCNKSKSAKMPWEFAGRLL